MIVISSNYVVNVSPSIDPDVPAVGWHNVVTATGIVADSQDANWPASNLANPLTHLDWRSTSTATQKLTITTGEIEQLDYVGIARHNFGSAEIAISLEANIDGVWTEIVEQFMPPNDAPLMLRYVAQSISQLQIVMQHGTAPPRAAVVYVGKLLDLERRVYVGHVPLPQARKTRVSNNRSESGNFLGRIVLGSTRGTTVPLSLISPDWYRENMEPFMEVAQETPFFFAWRPNSYPDEVGYCWFDDDPAPAPAAPSNLIALEWAVSGIA